MNEYNDIYSDVIQNAKDIKNLQFEMHCQNAMNDIDEIRFKNINKKLHNHKKAGLSTAIGVFMLGCWTIMVTKVINNIYERLTNLEKKHTNNDEE